MTLQKFCLSVALAICTAAAIILTSFDSLHAQPAPQSVQSATLVDLAKNADVALKVGDYRTAETILHQVLSSYCAESGLLQPSSSIIDISNAVQLCRQYREALQPSPRSQLRHQVIGQLEVVSSGSWREYWLPLEMAEAFKKLGDVYIELGRVYASYRDISTATNLYNRGIERYAGAVDIFKYQSYITQVISENTSGEQNCEVSNDFSQFLDSLFEIGEELLNQYRNSSTLSEHYQMFALEVSAKALEIALQRMSIFSYFPSQEGLYIDESGLALTQTLRAGEGWQIGWFAGIFNSINLSDDFHNELDGDRREYAWDRLNQGARQTEIPASASTCIAPRQYALEDRVAGVLQQVLLEQHLKGNPVALKTAYIASDTGRTLAVDQYIAYNLEQARREEEETLIRDLSKNLNTSKIGQIALENYATIVSYSIVSDDQLFIWVVSPVPETQDNLSLHKVNCREVLVSHLIAKGKTPSEQSCKALLQELIQPESLADGRGQARARVEALRDETGQQTFYSSETLKVLYQLLIQPIADLLPEDENQQVVFIPYGPLYFAPFAALQAETNKYLIESHTIRFAPNLRTLVLNYQNQRRNFLSHRSAVVVGNPEMPFVGLAEGQELISLPAAELEAVTIAELFRRNHFDVTRLLREQASEESVVREIESSAILHLATHGIIEDNSTSIPSAFEISGQIALAPSNENDGWLTALDLIKMHLNQTELVVLSACNTAQGTLIPGGVIGLPFALSLSGVQNIVASIWTVPDSPATVRLMEDFYIQILSGTNVATALRQAMINTKNTSEYADPRYWAGFTLIGSAH